MVGFEIKGPRYTGFARGGTKTAWTSNAVESDRRLVIVEGSIDALSYHQLYPDSGQRYLSTAGAPGPRQLEFIRDQITPLPEAAEVILATDADQAGDELTARLAALADERPVRRVRPEGVKDWNDQVRRPERFGLESEKRS